MVDPTPIRKSTTEDMIESLGNAYDVVKDCPDGYGLFVVMVSPESRVELIAYTGNMDDLQIAGAAAALQFSQCLTVQLDES